MSNNYNKEENELLKIITSLLSSDSHQKQQSKNIIENFAKSNYAEILKICIKFIKNEKEDIKIRYHSLLLLIILIRKENGKKYISLSEKDKVKIRAICLEFLMDESELIRKDSSMAVGLLGQISLALSPKEWPNLIQILCNKCESKENKFKLSGIKTLNIILENLPEESNFFTDEELLIIETSIIKILETPTNTEISLLCLKAYKAFIKFISNKFENKEFLESNLKLVLNFCKINNINTTLVSKCSILCINEITRIAYKYMDTFMTNILNFLVKYV